MIHGPWQDTSAASSCDLRPSARSLISCWEVEVADNEEDDELFTHLIDAPAGIKPALLIGNIKPPSSHFHPAFVLQQMRKSHKYDNFFTRCEGNGTFTVILLSMHLISVRRSSSIKNRSRKKKRKVKKLRQFKLSSKDHLNKIHV